MIGEKLGSYRIEATLGTGAMGVVYRATSETTGKLAAVKVISAEFSQKSKSYERFRRESEILQQFRHPNIVRFLALGRYQGTSYFAMEYVAGETMEQMLRRRGPIPWREMVDLSIQICDALHYAHEHGVVHRDLKPSNLMVSEKGQIKLTDFGIAKDLDATALTATGRTLGTAAYMAPEQIRGTPEVSHKTDLYALGVVLYQMLTGRTPFEGSSAVVLMHCHMNEPPPRPSAKVSEIPVALDKLVVQLMAKDPTERPWDAAAVSVALAEIRDKASRGETIPMVWPTEGDQASYPSRAGVEPPKKPKKSKPKRRIPVPEMDRSLIEIGLLVLALIAIGGFVGYMLWPPSAEYLYARAAELMKSSKPHDWITARDEYLEPLDRRFPDNPYRETTKAWRDQIEVHTIEGRAAVLESSTKTRFSTPNDRLEAEYQAAYQLASEASAAGNEVVAASYWDEMAKRLKPDDPDERRWFLLARKRSEALKRSVEQRRQVVLGLLKRVTAADLGGRPMEAATLRANLRDRFGKYTDIDDLLIAAGLKAPAFQPSTPPPTPAPTPAPAPAAAPAPTDKEAAPAPEPPPSSVSDPPASFSKSSSAHPSTVSAPHRYVDCGMGRSGATC